jgi:hypothetical protein
MAKTVSSINKTDHHDITEIVLKVALSTINLNPLQLTIYTTTDSIFTVAGISPRHHLSINLCIMSASQNETDTTKCNKYSNIPKEKLKYEYQDLIYFIEKSCGV